MDLQARKLKAIEYLIGLNDEKIFKKIEATIVEIKNQESKDRKVKPLSVQQLIDRAKSSSNDYFAGKYKTQDQLEKDSENW
jgi:hypothetical protein